ncbi:MAG: hypothetical protein CMJ20_04115 [Phycisphaeraceae bacterium]|nr:hypothetical protein [Phycisphaeraceae bacterium]
MTNILPDRMIATRSRRLDWQPMGHTNHHATRLEDPCLWTGGTGRANLARGTRWTQNTGDNKPPARLPAVRQ